MNAPRVVGLDLSWTNTGWADTRNRAGTFATKPGQHETKWDRLSAIVRAVDDFILYPRSEHDPAQLVVVEGPSFASKGRAVVDMGGLWWTVTHALHESGVRLLVCPPSVRAMFATGKGNAGKAAVVAAVARREPDLPIDSDDIVDAVALRALGAAVLGYELPGWEDMPKTHARAVETLRKALDTPNGASTDT